VRFTAEAPPPGGAAVADPAAAALLLLPLPVPVFLSGVAPARRFLAVDGGSGGEKDGKEVRKVGGGVALPFSGELPAGSCADGERCAELRRAGPREEGASGQSMLC
jgi:hypothetical protein